MSCPDQTDLDLAVNDEVIIRGKVTGVIPAGGGYDYCRATVQYTLNGALVSKTFHGSEIVKAEIDGSTIQGQIIGPG